MKGKRKHLGAQGLCVLQACSTLGALPDGVDGVHGWKKYKGARKVEGAWHPSQW